MVAGIITLRDPTWAEPAVAAELTDHCSSRRTLAVVTDPARISFFLRNAGLQKQQREKRRSDGHSQSRESSHPEIPLLFVAGFDWHMVVNVARL